jgi:hypothetical protein
MHFNLSQARKIHKLSTYEYHKAKEIRDGREVRWGIRERSLDNSWSTENRKQRNNIEGGSRKQASYSEILETLETHFPGIITEKRHNFDLSTPPAGAENLHFTLNGETRRAPGPPVARTQTAWEDTDQVSFTVPQYPHRQAWARAA